MKMVKCVNVEYCTFWATMAYLEVDYAQYGPMNPHPQYIIVTLQFLGFTDHD